MESSLLGHGLVFQGRGGIGRRRGGVKLGGEKQAGGVVDLGGEEGRRQMLQLLGFGA